MELGAAPLAEKDMSKQNLKRKPEGAGNTGRPQTRNKRNKNIAERGDEESDEDKENNRGLDKRKRRKDTPLQAEVTTESDAAVCKEGAGGTDRPQRA